MQKPTIEILILPDGQVKITVKGITGSRCLSLTEFLEEGLGDLVERELKEEYFQIIISVDQ